MRKFYYCLGVGLLACAGLMLLGLPPLGADDKAKDEKKEPPRDKASPGFKAVENIALANKLIAFGRAHKSAESLLLAAEILHRNPTEAGKEKPKGEASNDKGEVKVPTPKDLIAEAKSLPSANTDHVKVLIAAAEKALEEASRSPIAGSRHFHGYVGPRQSWNYYITLRGGEWTNAALTGFSGADLDLYIYDQFGNLVTQDTGISPNAYCSWYVPVTTTYRIRVFNYSSGLGSSYCLTVN